jgi:hypothetical protein
MTENVIKFRRPEKKPEPPVKKPRGPQPAWVPWLGLIGLAGVIYLARSSGWLGT